MISKLTLAKFTVHWLSIAGASKIVHDIIENNTDVITTKDKVKVVVGSFVLGSMVAEHVSEFTNDWFDELVEIAQSVKAAKETIQESK